MSDLITVDFSEKKTAFTVHYRKKDFRLKTLLIWANKIQHARLAALKKIVKEDDIRSIMLFKGHPANYKPTDKPELVMLQDEIQEFKKSC